MHPTQAYKTYQQKRVQQRTKTTNSTHYFNLLTQDALFDQVEALLPEHRERLFPPTETLSMFLAQAMNSDRSCQNIVNQAATNRLLGSLPLCSTDTGGYCRSRNRLPLAMISTLCRYTGNLISNKANPKWKWRNRPVRLVDGTTIVMPDTAENQQAYPQLSSQKPGLGFPICRLVGLICLGSGALLDMGMSAVKGKGNDEQTLLRSTLDKLHSGDILLGDAFYATYFLFCSLREKGIDAVFEQHGSRRLTVDFRKGKRFGPKDHIIEITKPKKQPFWMSDAEYAQAPNTVQVRECRAGGKILVTTLLCNKQTSKDELKKLYRERWHVELDFRNIKTTLGMEMVSCKTPEMVQKEIWVYLLAYNLIRMLMVQSALLSDIRPRQISFKHTVQLWIAWQHNDCDFDQQSFDGLLFLIAQNRVGNRQGRIEPRAVKRRPKPIALLVVTRDEARQNILKSGHPKKAK